MSSNQLPLSSSVAVFFAVIVSFFVLDPAALEGFRPAGDARNIKQVHGLEDVQARLWQDPFAAAADHQYAEHKTSHAKPFQFSAKVETKPFAQGESSTVALVLNPTEIKDTGETTGFHPHSLRDLIHEINAEFKEEPKGITVMAVMVPAGPYAKQAETRKRMRYAVLSGFGTSKYYPKDAEHIGYVDDLNTAEELDNYRGLNIAFGEEQLPLIMPYEWYERKQEEKKEEHVLLLWLDEDAFVSKPLTKLDVLVSSLGESVGAVKLIGPYSSGMLKKIIEQSKQPIGERGSFPSLSLKVDVYSATATAVDSGIAVGDGESSAKLLNKKVFKSFDRTIVTDDQLASLLYDEIQMRVPPKDKAEGYGVAVISEWDTAYGRALPKTLKKHYNNLHQFTYMRGIDGALAAQGNNGLSEKNDIGRFNDKSNKVTIERPEGRSQKDYLRRLAGQISALDESLKFSGKKGIRAIGVLGSDVYDKLLILRVLRKRFPNAIFFTTDLDVALLHPDQFYWTRNLIVASAFGLNLPDGQQKDVPAFRDSYQTSIYRSTIMAIEGKVETTPHSLVYEIGRSGAIAMALEGGEQTNEDGFWSNLFKTIQDNEVNLKTTSQYLTVLMFLVLLAVLSWRTRILKAKKRKIRKSGWVSFAFKWVGRLFKGFVLFLFFTTIFTVVPVVPVGEMGIFSQSQNLTTTVATICLSISLYIYFYWMIWWNQRPWRALSLRLLRRKTRRYRNSIIRFQMLKEIFYSVALITWTLFALLFRPFIYAKPVHLAFFLLVMFCIDLYEGKAEPMSLTEGISIWPTEFLRLIAVWLSFVLIWRGWEHMKKSNIKIGSEMGLSSTESYMPLMRVDIRYIWMRYKQEGTCRQRIKRAFWPTVIWLIICIMIFNIQLPNIPFRGESAYWTDLGVSVLAIFSVIMLFMFVVDSISHCRGFIRKLIRHDTWWPFMEKPRDKITSFEHKVLCDIKREWMETRIIAMLSGDISRMVYYPIFVILLLLVAQSDYFDNWGMPYTLVVVATLNVGLILFWAIALRRSAVKAREVSLENIRLIESEVLAICDNDLRERILRNLIFYKEKIKSIREGAFLPISEQPWLRAMTLMTGGGGSLLLLQYMGG